MFILILDDESSSINQDHPSEENWGQEDYGYEYKSDYSRHDGDSDPDNWRIDTPPPPVNQLIACTDDAGPRNLTKPRIRVRTMTEIIQMPTAKEIAAFYKDLPLGEPSEEE
ncbi:hypothetical protein L1987_00579 [Smallanthus sonchifolius]|uniref:Uncharacterized protein n=1 Tax=Smallanthus sonchifolius TaxID=185202 RepID=A0ACB9K2J6_9ASTR|nr:hypothetical protein L1987_00579 [Smallanthus sonchifolius]